MLDRFSRTMLALVAAVSLVACAGCGMITDKDRIKIAKIKDRYITRGDLAKLIRDTPDDERPIIRNKGDLLRVLNEYIDTQIKTPLAEEIKQKLQEQGKVLVARDTAKQRYFQEHAEDDYASMYNVQNPESVGMSPGQFAMMKQQIDLGIDRTLEKLEGETAVAVRAVEAFTQGKLTITDAEYEQEYKRRKDELKKLEWMQFWGFRFPANMPNAATEAATVKKRLDAGEKFEIVLAEYTQKNPEFVVRSEIENNPGLAKFAGFWNQASGCKKGDIIGPVFLPEYQLMGSADEQGRATVRNMPAAYLIIEVLEHRPETTLTLDEAKGELARYIIVGKMMSILREENGVEIYDDKLPDPAMFADRTGAPFGSSM